MLSARILGQVGRLARSTTTTLRTTLPASHRTCALSTNATVRAAPRTDALLDPLTQAKATSEAAPAAVITPDPASLGFESSVVAKSAARDQKTDSPRPIYLDMQATTPMDPRVLDAMMPYMTEMYGNPHSRTHKYGWETEDGIEVARRQVASLIGADPKEIVFTSGATESNNMSVKGVARFYKGKKNHIITTQTEHKCVLDSCRVLQEEGFDVTYLPVQPNGLIDLAELEKAMRPTTALVSVMTVNNEIGVIQPVAEIGAMCRARKIFFHTDAAQAVGKVPIDVNALNVDLMSISGHKIYGPKGIGALYVRRRPRVRLEPIQTGGGQERGLRSGSVPAPLVVGFGAACAISEQEMKYDHKRISQLSERLIKGITSKLDHVVRNGDLVHSYVGCVNLSFAYVEGESLLMALKDIALSSGSACTSASLEPSYVLRALGAEEDMAHSSIRFGIGRFTTEQEIDYVIDKVVGHVNKLREMSPLWEMVQEGIDLKSIQWSQH
ncbi:cysteine desulfurase [Tieghemiomyces parasiticus]|uniref:Cysteine desulfurase, mitosomal n=1 Tax=Tieghemiomyces parasiticus TaxID=78921 RepID=A0A9W8A5S0_9FUNG|nr:cysteine desulfurase [Tieghemiomyces parasiticus]